MRRTGKPRHLIGKLVLTALATFIAVVLGLNFVTAEKRIQVAPQRLYGLADPQFRHVLGTLLGPPILPGNRVTTLRNGDEIFPAMLAAIRAAQHNVDFETYVYWSGQIGRDFADAIAERARAGVKAHVLLDWVGSQRMDKQALETMREAGAQVELYHPLAWYSLARLNNRTHRKLLVVDGRVGFTGGVGIAAEWTGHAQDPEHWRDTHYRVEGPAVAQMQAAFEDNWTTVTGEVSHGAEYFPPLEPAGDMGAQQAQGCRLGIEQERDRIRVEARGAAGDEQAERMRADQRVLHLEPVLAEMGWLVHGWSPTRQPGRAAAVRSPPPPGTARARPRSIRHRPPRAHPAASAPGARAR